MPRLRKEAQAGRFAKGRKHRHQWPHPGIWGNGPGAGLALDRWIARHDCDGTCDGYCARLERLTRLRTAYRRRSR